MWVQGGRVDFLDAVFSVRVQYFSQNGFWRKEGCMGEKCVLNFGPVGSSRGVLGLQTHRRGGSRILALFSKAGVTGAQSPGPVQQGRGRCRFLVVAPPDEGRWWEQ